VFGELKYAELPIFLAWRRLILAVGTFYHRCMAKSFSIQEIKPISVRLSDIIRFYYL
jgi:hypothetical protein